MPTMVYKGRADVRSIDANAWKKVGVENQNKVTWNKENNFTAEVNEDAAKYLEENDSRNFTRQETSTSTGSGSESSSETSESTDDDATTRARTGRR